MEIIDISNISILESFFRDAFPRNNLIPIIGAGFTKNARARNGNVPDGQELESIMINEVCNIDSGIMPEDFIKEGYRFADIANEFFKKVPSERRKKILRNLFTQVNLDEERKSFLSIKWPYIYTLNIDDGIERNSDYEKVLPYRKLSTGLTQDYHCLFKMHGDVNEELKYEDLTSMIFSKEQYIRSLEKNKYILEYFQSDYSTKNIIFIGCSLTDELDLEYAIVTNATNNISSTNRIYIGDTEPKGLRKSRLESFGITQVVIVRNYNDFYKFILQCSSTLKSEVTDHFAYFKNPIIVKYPKSIENNKKYLLDIIGAKSSERSLPYFATQRTIQESIINNLNSEPITVISGKRFSGKTFLAKQLCMSIQAANVYLFPSVNCRHNRAKVIRRNGASTKCSKNSLGHLFQNDFFTSFSGLMFCSF